MTSRPTRVWSPCDFRIEVVLRADPLTAIMLSMVTFVSLLVAIYGIGYMHEDRGYWVRRFFSYIGLFVFSMTMLVSGEQFCSALRLLGGSRAVQLPADRILVRETGGRGGR